MGTDAAAVIAPVNDAQVPKKEPPQDPLAQFAKVAEDARRAAEAKEAEERRRQAEEAKSAKVFVCYRRDDGAGYAGRIQDRLEPEFGGDNLFTDVDAIPLGMDFVKILHDEVAKCGVLLAVMGPKWCDAHDEDGNRRLDNPNDFVRIEIATALQRNIPVITVLLDGAKVPKANRLPKDLRGLAHRNRLDVRHASFHSDLDRLIKALRSGLGEGLGS